MEPTVLNGALAIIREQPELKNSKIAVVLEDDDNETALKCVKLMLMAKRFYMPLLALWIVTPC